MHMEDSTLTNLDVLSALSRTAIESSIAELQAIDRLTIALRSALREGTDINDLSEATGLTTREIWRRAAGNLHVLSDLDELAGAA